MLQPKYMKLVEWVNDNIKSGTLKPGERLNSENELSELFSISRQTVRHAISELEREGKVERRKGSGTYVCNPLYRRKIENIKNISVVTTYVDDYIFPGIIKGMESVISEAGYTLQLAFTHNSVEKECKAIKDILSRNMSDGIIIEPTKSGIPNPNLELYKEIIEREIPTVFFNSYYPGIDIPHISLNDKKAGYIAAKHLIELSHTNIAGIFKSDDRQGHLRYSGYAGALTEAGLVLKDENVLWIDTEDLRNLSFDSRRVLKRLKGCSGCVCYNDEAAGFVERICKNNGINVPNELSLVSIDNSDIAINCEVPLTSVAHPKELLGKKAAEELIKIINSKHKKDDSTLYKSYEFEPELTVRGSTVKKQLII